MIKTTQLFDLTKTQAEKLLSLTTYPFEALNGLGEYIKTLGKSLSTDEYEEILPFVWAHKRASIAKTACLQAPCIIGEGTEIRHCAFIRGNALIGKNCVVGNSTEVKNAILFDGVQVPHYNYIGDSILGYKAHLGAGAITSNVKSDKTPVVVHTPDGDIPTGRKKLGAMIGDYAEIGCNSVLNPGTVIGKKASVYPLSSVRGCVPENGIYKKQGEIVHRQ